VRYICLILITLMGSMLAQPSVAKHTEHLKARDFLLSAARSDSRHFLLPQTNVARSNPSSDGPRASRIARARLGDEKEQQQFVCELYSADKQTMQSMALVDLPKIGGWYAIQMYRELLSPGARIRFYRAKNKPDRDSTSVSEPRIWSLAQLPKIVPNPPLNLPDPNLDNQELLRQVQLWKDWIHANEMSLRKLEPTGEGIDFSGRSCEGNRSIPLRNGKGPR
jgi:hypothetical protein